MGRVPRACEDGTVTESVPAPRRAYRSSRGSVLAGVCSGLAEHLGVTAVGVRVAFVLATVVLGIGVPLYLGLWLFLPSEATLARRTSAQAPGVAAAQRDGRSAPVPLPPVPAKRDSGPIIATAAVVVGLLLLVGQITGSAPLLWPLALLTGAVAVIWWQADEAQRQRWMDSGARTGPLRALVGSGTWGSWARLLSGFALLVSALVLYAVRSGDLAVAGEVALTAVLAVLGVGLMLGPWLVRLSSDLNAERAERIRMEERADLAAHLHDSVLQTLALIQKSAGDPGTVSRLARAQERDLRGWLYTSIGSEPTDLEQALRLAAAEVEDAHGVPVEVVCVGSGGAVESLVAAAREAMSNAARHSGAPRVDVYAETGPGGTDVFVRDRGHGFDLDAVPGDRHGVRGSIIERMRRHGGRAAIRTGPNGTEVHLHRDPEETP